MVQDIRVWTGTAWQSIVGPAGPTVVSADAGNVAKLGADGRISVQPADLDSRFVNVTGDTMTGSLAVKPVAIANGTVAAPNSGVKADTTLSTGTNVAAFYAATIGDSGDPEFTPKPNDYAFVSTGPAPSKLGGDLSVNGKVVAAGDLIGDRPILNVTASTTLSLLFRSYTYANTSTGGGTVTITIPSNATAAFPIGTKFHILDLSPTAPTIVAGAAGVTFQWNATITGAAAAVAGGVAGSLQMPGPISRITIFKVATDSWVAFT